MHKNTIKYIEEIFIILITPIAITHELNKVLPKVKVETIFWVLNFFKYALLLLLANRLICRLFCSEKKADSAAPKIKLRETIKIVNVMRIIESIKQNPLYRQHLM